MAAERLHRRSRVARGIGDKDTGRGIQVSSFGNRERAWDVLWEAQNHWLAMERFRQERERCKKYTFGRQWDDEIIVEGKRMTEEAYIKSQGNIPLKNNLIRRMVSAVLGVYRSQSKEPMCTARDRDEQSYGETIEEVPLIEYEWFMDSYWYRYLLTPFGDILEEGETPYAHKSHPYVFKAYPFPS